MRNASRSTVAVAVLGLCLFLPAAAHATYPGLNGKIAFSRAGDIWTMGPDGSNQSKLISTGSDPAWSADGSQLAYACGAGSGANSQICAANADGSSQRAV